MIDPSLRRKKPLSRFPKRKPAERVGRVTGCVRLSGDAMEHLREHVYYRDGGRCQWKGMRSAASALRIGVHEERIWLTSRVAVQAAPTRQRTREFYAPRITWERSTRKDYAGDTQEAHRPHRRRVQGSRWYFVGPRSHRSMARLFLALGQR